MTDPVIGFIGIGKMGTPMVRRVAQLGCPVMVYDSRPAAVTAVEGVEGVQVVSSLSELGRSADAVITMLPNGTAVREVVLGASGTNDSLASNMREGAVLIDMSSSAPWETARLSEDLSTINIHLVDAPVSGGVARAVTGELAIFVGGSDEDFETVRPILAAMGTQLLRTGRLGSGHAAKSLNNLLSAACFSATIEVVRIAQAWGIEGSVIAEVLNAATGRNNTTDRKLRQFVLSERYDSGFALALMVKDLKQSEQLAEMVGLDVPLSRLVVESWVSGSDRLAKTADHTEMARVLALPVDVTKER